MADSVWHIWSLVRACQHPDCTAPRTTHVQHRSIADGWEKEVCENHIDWAKAEQMRILQSIDR